MIDDDFPEGVADADAPADRAGADCARPEDQPALRRRRRPQGPGQGRQGQRHRAVLRPGVPARPVRRLRRRGHDPGGHRARSARSSPTTTSTGTSPSWSSRPSASGAATGSSTRSPSTLNEKDDVYEAEFANLGIKRCSSTPATIKAHPKLLVGGVWCICDIEYLHSDDARVSCRGSSARSSRSSSRTSTSTATSTARREFTTDEWIDLLIQSIGFNPELFGRRAKLIQLVRLIPFVERNYNLVELGPKGTGKSHIFSEFSPHGMLISGGEVTVPKLFVNNSNGRIGLVGYWDVVAFDEFAGKKKRTDKALVDIMKNYMANKSFSRGVETLGAEASMVFVGNTSHNVPYMLKHSDLFDELPESYHDSAYLDRLHHYIPGWEVDTIRGEMFSDGYGFVVDYIAEVLKSMRNAGLLGPLPAALHALARTSPPATATASTRPSPG